MRKIKTIKVPARKIKAIKGIHYRYKVPFLKTCVMIICESSIERDFIRICDFDTSTIDIISQPLVIYYSYKQRTKKYYPDFKVIKEDGQIIIVEIKSSNKLYDLRNEIKYAIGRLYCEKMGWEYRIITENEIRPGYLQRNLALLRAFGHQPISYAALNCVYSNLTINGECTVEILRSECSELDVSQFYCALYQLIYFHKIYVDLINDELSDMSYISC